MSIRSGMSAVPPVYWIAVAVAVIANIAANTAFKSSVAVVSGESVWEKAVQLLTSPVFWLGAVSAAVLLVSFLIAVKNGPMSTTYVLLTSLAIVGLVAVDFLLFGVPVNLAKILGLCLVIGGVWLLAGTLVLPK